jgi:hypothetical protein
MSFLEIYDRIILIDENTSLEERKRLFTELAVVLLCEAQDIQRLVVLTLERIPDGFFMYSTEHRTAAQERDSGGLLRHTARVLKFALIISELSL